MGICDRVVPPQWGLSWSWDKLADEEKLQEQLWDTTASSDWGLCPFQPQWGLFPFYFWLC